MRVHKGSCLVNQEQSVPLSAYIELTKPRISLMVIVTAAIGYFLAATHYGVSGNMQQFLIAMLGIGLAGGGASVRGYGYQAIGPRYGEDDDPVGGKSLAEFSLEGRIRFGNFGVVPFVDAGNISTSFLPRFRDLRVGAGIGVRYYSNFGPIRVDVGTPINPQSGDPKIAVYVSLGQAF